MSRTENSLRLLVEKWLTPTASTLTRVTRFGRIASNQSRYVCIEAIRPQGPVAIFFFRHDDGTWRVFPPETEHLTMRTG